MFTVSCSDISKKHFDDTAERVYVDYYLFVQIQTKQEPKEIEKYFSYYHIVHNTIICVYDRYF